MKEKHHVLTSDFNIEFLGWCSSFDEATELANAKYGDDYYFVLTDSTLYKFIEQSKVALNHD